MIATGLHNHYVNRYVRLSKVIIKTRAQVRILEKRLQTHFCKKAFPVVGGTDPNFDLLLEWSA